MPEAHPGGMMAYPTPELRIEGEGLPLLFLHGNGADHQMMYEFDIGFDLIGGWQRIHLDLPGFGQTDPLPEPGGLADLAAWVDAVTQDVIGDQPFAVIGTSLGGLLAQDLVVRRKAQCVGLALLVPVIFPDKAQRTIPQGIQPVVDQDLLDSLSAEEREWFTQLVTIQTEPTWIRFEHLVIPGLKAVDPNASARLNAQYTLDPLPCDQLADFDRPVLIVAGRQDWVVGYTDQWTLAQRLPHATFGLIDGAGHMAQLEEPRIVFELVRDWASRVQALLR